MHIPDELRTQLISEYPMYKPYIIDLVLYNIIEGPHKECFTQVVEDEIKESNAQTQAQKDAIFYQMAIFFARNFCRDETFIEMIKEIYAQARETVRTVRENSSETHDAKITIPSTGSLFHRQLRASKKAYSIPKKRTPLRKNTVKVAEYK